MKKAKAAPKKKPATVKPASPEATPKSEVQARSWPASAIEMWPIDKIKPYPKNPRSHSKDQIKLLASLMVSYGVDQPIVVDEKGVIIKGHGRRLGAIQAGFTKFPVAVHHGLTEIEKSAMRIQDNQVGLLAGWDAEMIKFELDQLRDAGYDLPSLGFDQSQLVEFMTGLGDNEDADRSRLLELVNVTIAEPTHQVSLGDHYVLSERHHLFCESVVTGWNAWAPHLTEGALFCPYPGVFVPFGAKAKDSTLIMVQRNAYIAGHILDRYSEVYGEKAIEKVESTE